MNRNIILIALLGLLFVSKAVAQSVTVEAKIDSLQILIGEQAKVQLQVAMDAKQRAIFPAYTDTLVRGVEIIETVKPDTQFLNDRQRMVITQEYIITSFDSALYYLPPMPVTVDGKVYNSKALALKVYSMPAYSFGRGVNPLFMPSFCIFDSHQSYWRKITDSPVVYLQCYYIMFPVSNGQRILKAFLVNKI